MSEKKQSSIDWLIEKISYQTSNGEVITYHKNIADLIQQAKAMRKQEMKDLYLAHVTKAPRLREIFEKQFEEYYTNTFE